MPVVTMIAGPNGSGKSTLIQKLSAQGMDFGAFFNADDIARTLPGDRIEANLLAQQMVRDQRDEARTAGRNYAWETVMSHPSHIDHLVEAKRAGYEARVIYVAIDDSRVNQVRVRERVDNGGHDVPHDKILSRYQRSLAQLPTALLKADYALVFDNSSASEPYRLLCEIRPGAMTLRSDFKDMPAWFQAALRTMADRGNLTRLSTEIGQDP